MSHPDIFQQDFLASSDPRALSGILAGLEYGAKLLYLGLLPGYQASEAPTLSLFGQLLLKCMRLLLGSIPRLG